MENQPKELINWTERDNIENPLSLYFSSEKEADLHQLNKLNNFNNIQENHSSKKIKFITNPKKFFFISKKTKKSEDNIEIHISNSSIGRWTKEERYNFANGIYKYGPDFNKINTLILTRNIIQIRSHAQKFLKRLRSSKYLEKKNVNISNLNWKNIYKLLKKKLTDEEFFSLLISIDSEIEDNERWSQKKENAKFNNLKSNIEENLYKENKFNDIFMENLNGKNNNNLINLKEEYNDRYFLNSENYLTNNILYDDTSENLNLSGEFINNSFNFNL